MPRRSQRENLGQKPVRYDDYVLYKADENCESFETETFNQAARCKNKTQWLEAMQKEIDSIEGNNTWKLCDLPPGKICSKWVFKVKKDENGKVHQLWYAIAYRRRLPVCINVDDKFLFTLESKDGKFQNCRLFAGN